MLKGDRGAVFAVGLVAGIGLALFFFVWAFPWFSDPHQSASYCQTGDQDCAKHYQNSNDPHFWVSPFYGWIYAEDTLAQWIMAAFAVAATGVSFWAVRLVGRTLTATREGVAETRRIGEAQIRSYLHIVGSEIEFTQPLWTTFGVINIVNTGQSPAYNVEVKGRLTGEDWTTFNNNHVTHECNYHSDIIASGEKRTIQLFWDSVGPKFMTAISNGDHMIILDGILEWKDVFGIKCQIGFRASGRLDKTRRSIGVLDDIRHSSIGDVRSTK